MRHAHNKKVRKDITEEIELPNQKRIRMLREKETYKYLVILEVDTVKQVKMKEKNEKSISDERENFSEKSSAEKIAYKG